MDLRGWLSILFIKLHNQLFHQQACHQDKRCENHCQSKEKIHINTIVTGHVDRAVWCVAASTESLRNLRRLLSWERAPSRRPGSWINGQRNVSVVSSSASPCGSLRPASITNHWCPRTQSLHQTQESKHIWGRLCCLDGCYWRCWIWRGHLQERGDLWACPSGLHTGSEATNFQC